MAILPVPTTRVSDYLVRERLRTQVQSQQLDLFRLQNQVSTGRRVFAPSDDVPAALRAITLQRTIERKSQLKINAESAQATLSSADNSLRNVADVLNTLRASAIGVVGTDATQTQRDAVINEIDTAITTLLDIGSSKHIEQFLYSGTRTLEEPYTAKDTFIEYRGNERSLRSRVDSQYLFDVGLPGDEVFGGLSEGVLGEVDLNPHLTPETQIAHLNRGEGVDLSGAITIAYQPSIGGPTQNTVVNLQGASTLADVARRLEEGAPPGAGLAVDISGSRLRVTSADGTFVLSETANGTTAEGLGLTQTLPASSLTGADLEPTLRLTTPLGNLLGTKAQGRVRLPGTNNDFTLTAAANGAAFNNLTVVLAAGGTAGAETATYTPGTNTLQVTIEAGKTTAAQVVAAINAQGTFVAAIDQLDTTDAAFNGLGSAAGGTYSGATDSSGSGTTLDLAAGFIVENGSGPVTIDTSSAETVEDLLNLLNRPDLGLAAGINSSQTGIDVRTRRSGADLRIGENGGLTATQLGIRTFAGATRLSELNRGLGVPTVDGADFEIEIADGATTSTFAVDLSSATTVQDAIAAINTATGGQVTARLKAAGGGIELVETSALTDPVTLTLRSLNQSTTAEALGLVAEGETTVSTTTGALQGEDRSSVEVDSVFNSLIRLRDALKTEDNAPEVSRAIERLDDDLTRLTFARSEVGSRLQNLDSVTTRLVDEDVQLQSSLSNEIDVDLAEAISKLTAQQYTLEATLRTTASLLQLSILNFI